MDSSYRSTDISQFQQSKYDHSLVTQSSLTYKQALNITIHEEAQDNPDNVDWDGPDDTANPLNRSRGKKLAAIVIVSFNTFPS